MREFKVCQNCGKKIFKDEYQKNLFSYIRSQNRLNYLWTIKKYCSYDCSYKFNTKNLKEKQSGKAYKVGQLTFNAPFEIWKVENGKTTQIRVLLGGEWKVCQILNKQKQK